MFCDLIDVETIRKNKAKDIGLPILGGVYKWWCKKATLIKFLEQLGKNLEDVEEYIEFNKEKQVYCFYVGQTKSKKGLAERIKSQHVGKSGKKNPYKGRAIQGSTLRFSINSLKNGGIIFDEDYVDNVLNGCFVQWVGIEDASRIDKIEKDEINAFLRILNLDDFEDNDQKFIKIRSEIAKVLSSTRKRK